MVICLVLSRIEDIVPVLSVINLAIRIKRECRVGKGIDDNWKRGFTANCENVCGVSSASRDVELRGMWAGAIYLPVLPTESIRFRLLRS